MTDFDSELSIKVKGKELIVTLAGSNYAVTYSATALPDYSIVNTDDPRLPRMTAAQFLARVWKLANEKAESLGG